MKYNKQKYVSKASFCEQSSWATRVFVTARMSKMSISAWTASKKRANINSASNSTNDSAGSWQKSSESCDMFLVALAFQEWQNITGRRRGREMLPCLSSSSSDVLLFRETVG